MEELPVVGQRLYLTKTGRCENVESKRVIPSYSTTVAQNTRRIDRSKITPTKVHCGNRSPSSFRFLSVWVNFLFSFLHTSLFFSLSLSFLFSYSVSLYSVHCANIILSLLWSLLHGSLTRPNCLQTSTNLEMLKCIQDVPLCTKKETW